MLIKPLDFGIILPAFAVVAASFFFAYSGASSQSSISIKGENSEWIFPLDAEETVTIPGPLGDSVVEIHDGSVRFLASPCANQTCVASGSIDSQGQWAACLPNKVMLVIAPEKHNSVRDDNNIDASTW